MTSNMGSQIIQEKFENLKEAWRRLQKLQSGSTWFTETNGASVS
jgi:hypothetical protein